MVLRTSLFALLASCIFFTAPVTGQTSGGATVQGVVKDQTGGVIPGAKISIVQVETKRTEETRSNTEGFFVTPPLQIGSYTIRCEAPGMKAWEQRVTLQAGATAEVSPVLSPGQVSETVEVSASVPLITTTEATDATTLDQQRIKELPINGRDLNTLLSDVTPGVEQIIDVYPGVRAGGLMVYSTQYTQDGASATNREIGGSVGLSGLDSIGEVRIETSTGNAKSSSPISVIISTRGGTNRYRFSVFETLRDNAWGVARRRQDVNPNGTPLPLPKLIRNEFGGTVGGPVILPSFGLNGRKFYDGHNRTFFFFSREQIEFRQGITNSYSVPTAAMRQGIFTGLETNTGLPITLYDPQTGQVQTQNNRPITVRQPFPNNVIPVTRESPLAKYIYSITPLPTDITEPNIVANLKFGFPTVQFPNIDDDPTTIRIDHRLTGKDNFFAKANWGYRTYGYLGTSGSIGVPTTNLAANASYLPTQNWSGALSDTHIFAPNFFVENLLNRTWLFSRVMDGPPNQQQNWAANLGLPNPFQQIGWPNIQNIGTNFAPYIEGDQRRGLGSVITNAQQNYSWIKGTHTVQFGWSWNDEVQRLLPDQGAISGTANFNSLATALESSTTGSTSAPAAVTNTGFDAANFFLGDAANYNVYLSRGVMKVDEKTAGLYLQDNWKVTSRLTLTPGIRWDINPAFNDEHHLLNSFDVKNHAIVLPEPLDYYYHNGATTPQVISNFQKVNLKFESSQDAGMSSQLFSSNYFNFGPRVGAAYRVLDGHKSFVIRGGYGLYYSLLPLRTLLAQFASNPPFKSTFSYNPNNAAQSPDGTSNYLLTHTSNLIAGLNTANAVDLSSPAALGIGQSIFAALAPNLPTTRVHEWNVELEKDLGHQMVLRVKYDGKHGSDLDQMNNINPAPSTYVWYTETGSPLPTGSYASVATRAYDQTAYTDIRMFAKTGFSNSAMGVLELEKRFSKGLQFQFFYSLTNAYRLAGNSSRDGIGTTPGQFLPGSVPTDPAALNRFLYYARDTAVPKHRVRWNWIYDLPFGSGKTFANHAPKWLNAMIGGWTLTGNGTVVSTWFALDSSNWNFTGSPVEVYGTKYKIQDCTATPSTAKTSADERCYSAYLYWNGYLSPRLINSVNGNGVPNGYMGVPSGYKPAVTPLIPYGAPGALTSDYDSNVVYIKLSDGSTQRVSYDTGLNPFRNQYRLGPFNWNMDSSLRKTFRFNERTTLRFAMDVFNIFNRQGLNTPATSGVVTLQNSFTGFGFAPRQVQGSFRLEF